MFFTFFKYSVRFCINNWEMLYSTARPGDGQTGAICKVLLKRHRRWHFVVQATYETTTKIKNSS